MPESIKRLLAALSTAEGIRGLITSPLVWPWLSAGVGAVLAYTDGYDRTAIFLAALLAFAAMTAALLWFDQWRERRTALNKLLVAGTGLFRDIAPLEEGQGARLTLAQMGVILHNSAAFPISYIAERVDNTFLRKVGDRIEQTVPDNPVRNAAAVIVGPGQMYSARGRRIDFGGVPCGPLQGQLSYRIRYGKPGKERYILQDQLGMSAKLDPETGTIKDLIWEPGGSGTER